MKALELIDRMDRHLLMNNDKSAIGEAQSELRRLAEVNAELLEALKRCEDYFVGSTAWTQQQEDDLVEYICSNIAKAKEQQ